MEPSRYLESLEGVRTAELFKMYRGILRELTRRGIVRMMNAPAGDYAEYLVAALTRGELADNSEKSWDIRTATGERLQVKCRVVQEGNEDKGSCPPFRTWDFDRAVIVPFDDRHGIQRDVGATEKRRARAFDVSRARERPRQAATDAVMNHPSGENWTDDLRG